MQALGIDVGSTSIKGAVLDIARQTVSAPVSRPFPAPLSGGAVGRIEIDPLAVCTGVDAVLAALIEQAPDADRVFFSGQMGGLILLDDHGRPLTNYLSWRDQRTLGLTGAGRFLLEEIQTRWESEDLLVTLGQELQPGSTTALLAWLHPQGELPSHARPASIADFVIARLAGHPIPMHATHAIGMLDLTRDAWHRPALEAIGLHDLRLPELALTEEASARGPLPGAGCNCSALTVISNARCAERVCSGRSSRSMSPQGRR